MINSNFQAKNHEYAGTRTDLFGFIVKPRLIKRLTYQWNYSKKIIAVSSVIGELSKYFIVICPLDFNV